MPQPPYASVRDIADQAGALGALHFDSTMRDILRGDTATHDPRFFRFSTGEPHPLANFAVIRDTDDPDAARAALTPLASLDAPSAAVCCGSTGPGGVNDALQSLGYTTTDSMPVMVIDIDAMRTPEPDASCDVARISADDAQAWASAFEAGYELPTRCAEAFSPLEIPIDDTDDAPVQFFAAKVEGRVVSTSFLRMAEGLAGVYGVSTIPEFRKRGIAARVTAHTLRAARELGFCVGALQSSHAGQNVYRSLGFRDVGKMALLTRAPS